jgi:hypothetical protein
LGFSIQVAGDFAADQPIVPSTGSLAFIRLAASVWVSFSMVMAVMMRRALFMAQFEQWFIPCLATGYSYVLQPHTTGTGGFRW